MKTAAQRRQSNKLISNPDVTVFFAIFIVLFCFFVTLGPHASLWQGQSRDVNLPKVTHAVPLPGANREDALVVVIQRDGQAFIGFEHVYDIRNLSTAIRERVARGSPGIVYMKVDARAKNRFVNEALEAIRVADIERIYFLADERKSQSLTP